jgi:hypothetical protein
MFLTWPISVMDEILSGFTSMPRSVMMYPKSLLRGTPNVHFSGLSLMLNYLSLLNVSSRSAMRLLLFRDFMMMSSTSTFELHFYVEETAEGGDEHGGRLVHFSEGYLVITQVGVQET